jgi:hypothetical protein
MPFEIEDDYPIMKYYYGKYLAIGITSSSDEILWLCL